MSASSARQPRWPFALPLAVSGALLGFGVVSPPLLALPPAAYAAPLPYPEAVAQGRKAASAVLARAGVESCLRGKLTRALLGLSRSCEASGTSNPLCSLADKAVVVTPMTLVFMDATSHELLALIHPGASGPQASAKGVEPQPESVSEP